MRCLQFLLASYVTLLQQVQDELAAISVARPMLRYNNRYMISWLQFLSQDQDSLLVKRRNDNHSPGPVIRELVPSSH